MPKVADRPLPGRRRLWWWGGGLAVVVVLVVGATALLDSKLGAPALERRLSRLVSPDSLHQVSIGATSWSLFRRSYHLTEVAITPDTARIAQWRTDGKPQRVLRTIQIGAVHLDRVSLGSLLRGDIEIGRVRIIEPKTELFLDKTVKPEPTEWPPLPHLSLQALARRVRIDTVQVERGELVYLERAIDGARPGRFRFGDVWTTITNVTNDSARSDARAEIELSATLGKAGRFETKLVYDLFAPRLRIAYQGRLTAMDARAFNTMLVDLDGFRVTSGSVDSVRFDVAIDDDVATGKLRAIYRDLKISKVDKITRKGDIDDWFQSLFFRKFKLNSENPRDSDEPAMVAAIHLTRRPTIPLIQFLWHTIRAGLSTTIGIT